MEHSTSRSSSTREAREEKDVKKAGRSSDAGVAGPDPVPRDDDLQKVSARAVPVDVFPVELLTGRYILVANGSAIDTKSSDTKTSRTASHMKLPLARLPTNFHREASVSVYYIPLASCYLYQNDPQSGIKQMFLEQTPRDGLLSSWLRKEDQGCFEIDPQNVQYT